MFSHHLRRCFISQAKLFTPSTVNTSKTVKEVMLYDHSDQHPGFKSTVVDINERLLKMVKASSRDYASVLLPGTEFYALEAAIGTSFPQLTEQEEPKTFLVVSNGASGERIVKICEYLDIPNVVLRFSESEPITVSGVLAMLRKHPTISQVAAVHNEIATGLLNPVTEIGQLLHDFNPDITFIVDAISSFGAVDLDLYRAKISYLVGSPNNLIQSVPGLGFVLVNIGKLRRCRGHSRSVALDLWSQWNHQLRYPGEFPSEPPTHVVTAFHQALLEHEKEGGIAGRRRKCLATQASLEQALKSLGFKLLVDFPHQGFAVTTVLAPEDPNYDFNGKSHTVLSKCLRKYDIVICPGNISRQASFRIGTMGELRETDVKTLVETIKAAFRDMKISLPIKPQI